MIVIDTNVFVTALRSRSGVSRRIVRAIFGRQIDIGASPALFLEYEAVLSRPEQRAASGLTLAEVREFLDGLALITTPIALNFLWRPQLHDPADEMVLEAAVNGMATDLVTWNVRDFKPAMQSFGLRVSKPDIFWKTFSKESS
jgi:putative PIN family toxin of toxin-antitoxin system